MYNDGEKTRIAVQAKELRHEVKSYLGIKTVKNVRVLIRYDVENLSDATFERACNGVFAEPPVDVLYREDFPREESDHIFSVEFLPGQFDQRADSAVQCVKFLNEEEEPVIRSATTYVIEGEVSDEEFEAIKHHCINPVDSREIGMEKPETLVAKFEEPADVGDPGRISGYAGGRTEETVRFFESCNDLQRLFTYPELLQIRRTP